MTISPSQHWSEVSTGAHLLQVAAEKAAEAALTRDASGLHLALAHAEDAIRKARRNLRRALKAEETS